MIGVLVVGSMTVLFMFAMWCIFSSKYDDGLVGKFIFIMLSLSCYAVISAYPEQPSSITKLTFMVSLASAALRHFLVFQVCCRIHLKRIRRFFYD